MGAVNYGFSVFLLFAFDLMWGIWGIVEAAQSKDPDSPTAMLLYFSLPIMAVLWYFKCWVILVSGFFRDDNAFTDTVMSILEGGYKMSHILLLIVGVILTVKNYPGGGENADYTAMLILHNVSHMAHIFHSSVPPT